MSSSIVRSIRHATDPLRKKRADRISGRDDRRWRPSLRGVWKLQLLERIKTFAGQIFREQGTSWSEGECAWSSCAAHLHDGCRRMHEVAAYPASRPDSWFYNGSCSYLWGAVFLQPQKHLRLPKSTIDSRRISSPFLSRVFASLVPWNELDLNPVFQTFMEVPSQSSHKG